MNLTYYQKVCIVMLYGWLMLYATRMVLSPCLPLIMNEFSLTYAAGGFLFVVYFYAYVAMQFLGGLIGDRVGRKKVLLVGTAFWSFISLLTGFSKTLWELFTYRLFLGVGQGAHFGNDRAIVSAYTPKGKEGMGQALSMTGMGVGMALGMALGGLLGQTYGWRLAFVILSFPAILCAFLVAKFIREPSRPALSAEIGQENRIRYAAFFRNRDLLLLYASNAMNMYNHWFLATWVPTVMVEVGLGELGTASMYASLFGFSAVPGLLLLGALSDKMAKRGMGRKALISIAFASVTFLTILAAFAVEARASTSVMALLMVLEGLFIWGFYAVTYSLTSTIAPPLGYGTVFGLINAVGFTSSIVAPWLTGMIRDTTGSFALCFYTAALPPALGCLFALFIRPPFRLKPEIPVQA